MTKLTAFFSLLLCSTFVIAEETRYVTDSFSVTMRTGMGTEHKIIRSPTSGVKMTLLEENKQKGYSHVRISNGMEGWILSRYLVRTPSAKTRLSAAEEKAKSLRIQVKKLESQLSATSKSKTGFEKDSSRLNKNNKKLEKELTRIKDIASNQISINKENKTLKEEVLKLKREMQSVQQENMSLADDSAKDWFFIGAGVIIAGIIIGLILPNLRFRRKQSWNTL